MIITLQEAKSYLRVDFDDDDDLIETLILASETYLFNATNVVFDNTNKLAVLYIKVLVKDWYENRELMADKKVSNKVLFTMQSILLQLKCEGYNYV